MIQPPPPLLDKVAGVSVLFSVTLNPNAAGGEIGQYKNTKWCKNSQVTLPMLMLLLPKAQGCKDLKKKP